MEIGKKTARNFGKRLKELREAKGLSQERFAEVLNLNSTYISRIETGKRSPSLPNIARIAQALGVPIASLFETPLSK